MGNEMETWGMKWWREEQNSDIGNKMVTLEWNGDMGRHGEQNGTKWRHGEAMYDNYNSLFYTCANRQIKYGV